MPPRRRRWCNRCCPWTPSQPPRTDRQKPALSHGAVAAFETTDSSPRSCCASCEADRTITNYGNPGSAVCRFFSATLSFLGPEKTSSTRMQGARPIELQARGPGIEGASNCSISAENKSALQLGWQGRRGTLVPWRHSVKVPRSAEARNDVMLRPGPRAPCVVSSLQMVLANQACRSSMIRFRPRLVTCPPKKPRRAWRYFSLDAWVKRPLTVF